MSLNNTRDTGLFEVNNWPVKHLNTGPSLNKTSRVFFSFDFYLICRLTVKS